MGLIEMVTGGDVSKSSQKKMVAKLELLKQDAQELKLHVYTDDALLGWRGRVEAVLSKLFGSEHRLVQQFINNDFSYASVSADSVLSRVEREEALDESMDRAIAIINVAIFELDELSDSNAPTNEGSFDAELWSHVHKHIEHEDWQTVASQTAIFVEDRVRRWSGATAKDGQALTAKPLFTTVLSDDSKYRLGNQRSEWEGWRALGVGFALALGNVDRHNIQERKDAKKYAMGVLGLGSLILTQIKHEHGPEIAQKKRPRIGVRPWTPEETAARQVETAKDLKK